MKIETTGVRRSHRRMSIAGTVVAGGTLALFLGPLAGAASAATNYPPSDSCAITVLPSASTVASAASTACSQSGSGIQPTAASRPSAAPTNPAANSGTKSGGGLAFTGADVPLVAGIGTLMVVGGVMIVVQSRRRQV